MFKVGDKIRVKKDLELYKRYGADMVVDEMDAYRGKTGTITWADSKCELYRILIDDEPASDDWIWTRGMLELATDIDVTTKTDVPESNVGKTPAEALHDFREAVTKFQSKEGESVTKFQKLDYTENIKAIMQRQHDKGLKKYGETLEDNTSLNMMQRIEHLEEELIDGLQYCEHIKAVSNDNFKANDFQRAVLRTAGNDETKYLDNAIMGLAGEVGECADIVKKYHFQGHEFDREHFAEELGDVLWYASLAATAINMPLDEVMKRNIEKLKKRYPDGFDKARSINREDEEVKEND